MNWVCDSNANFLKGTDLNTGLNYSSEISNLISTTYQFPQLTDLTGAVSTTPADRTTAPNNDCSAQITVTADGTDGNVTYVSAAQGAPASTTFPASVEPYSYYASALQAHGAGTVVGTGVPAGTQVLSAGGGTSITLSSVLPAGNYTLDFLGVPAVTEASTTP
jgi:hypothetical protein